MVQLPWTDPRRRLTGDVHVHGQLRACEVPTTIAVVSASDRHHAPGQHAAAPEHRLPNTVPLLGTGIGLVVVGGLILLFMRKRTERAGRAV